MFNKCDWKWLTSIGNILINAQMVREQIMTKTTADVALSYNA